MLLNEVFIKHPMCQVVLSLTNNNVVLITKDDFDPNSKFYRMSKVRLFVDFELSGIIKDGVFIRTTGQELTDNSNEAYIYRTYRGDKKNDYVLYIYKGEYQLIEHYRKAVSHKKLIAETKERKEPKYNTQPTPDRTLTICPHINAYNKDDKRWYVSFKHKDFPCDYLSKQYEYTYNDVNAYLKATVFGLTLALKYIDRISKIEVHHPNNDYAKCIYMLATGKWRPKRSMTKIYVNTIDMLRREFQEHGISIIFME